MNVEHTLSIIKPDAMVKNLIGKIYQRFEDTGFTFSAVKMCQLSAAEASVFYIEHQHQPFFTQLIAFMCSQPIMVQVLQAPDVVARYRALMGATDPHQAAAGTLRADFGENLTHNAVHGSDNLAAARCEINFFFAENELFVR